MATLTNVFVDCATLANLDTLRSLPLRELCLDGCGRVGDIAPLAEVTSLEMLVLPPGDHDLGPIRKLPRLRRVSYEMTMTQPWQPRETAEEFWAKHGGRPAAQEARTPTDLIRQGLIEHGVPEQAAATVQLDPAGELY